MPRPEGPSRSLQHTLACAHHESSPSFWVLSGVSSRHLTRTRCPAGTFRPGNRVTRPAARGAHERFHSTSMIAASRVPMGCRPTRDDEMLPERSMMKVWGMYSTP